MNSLEFYDKKPKYNFIKKVELKDPTVKDIVKIISLIKEEYGENYPEQHFYNKKSIKKAVYRATKDTNFIWKCAFLNDSLIGQVIFEISNSVGFIKSTIIRKNFRHLKVLSLLGYYLAKEIKKVSGFDLKYIYAIVDKDNNYVNNFISKYRFIELAKTPMWEVDRYFNIFGRKSFNLKDKWTQANLDFNLFKDAFYIIKKTDLKVHIQAYSLLNQVNEKSKLINLRRSKSKDAFSTKSLIFFSKDDKKEVLCAEMTENTFLKSWYNFRFMNNFPYSKKIQVLNFVFNLFENSSKINSFSLIINTKDYKTQNFLFKNEVKFFGFLPYYLEGEHAILMGKSKITEE